MKLITLKCAWCGVSHKKPVKEWNRRIRLGKNKAYCCQAHATADEKTVHTNITRQCAWCGKNFESTTHKYHRTCCSKLCAHRVSQSHVDTKKISTTLLKFKAKTSKIQNNVCAFCKLPFVGKTKYCSKKCVIDSRRAHLPEYEKYKRACQFNFALSEFPTKFDFKLIEQFGWYSPKNHGNNLNGVSRDHIMSVRWGFDHGVDPKYIKHPANCQLMRHNDNVSKGKQETISIQELISRIESWDSDLRARSIAGNAPHLH